MSITASIIFRTTALGGGLTHVEEHHTASDGKVHKHFYMATAQTDQPAALAAYAVELAQRLADEEADGVLNG